MTKKCIVDKYLVEYCQNLIYFSFKTWDGDKSNHREMSPPNFMLYDWGSTLKIVTDLKNFPKNAEWLYVLTEGCINNQV